VRRDQPGSMPAIDGDDLRRVGGSRVKDCTAAADGRRIKLVGDPDAQM
jgi:hypothetical protein